MRNVTGYSFHQEPFHEHDCDRCNFLFSFGISTRDCDYPYPHGTPKMYVDVYENCDNISEEAPYLIRYSSDGPDYATTGIRSLVASYVVDHMGLELKNRYLDVECYPLADRHPAQKIGGNTKVVAMNTKKFRKPRKGEWYLSGAQIAAYKAPNDLNNKFLIAKIVEVEERVVENWLRDLPN